jgi:hypothetical protein
MADGSEIIVYDFAWGRDGSDWWEHATTNISEEPTINFWSRIKPAHATDGPKRRVRPREWLSLVPHKTSYLHPC